MVIALSVVSVILGAGLACAADHVPSHVAALQRCGGALLVAGLALLGAALPLFR